MAEPDKASYFFSDPQRAYADAESRINEAATFERLSLDLDGYGLTRVPPTIEKLKSLRRLSLDSNRLTSLPPEIETLSKLRHLSINKNFLTHLPDQIFGLSSLVVLSVAENKLKGIPAEIGKLTRLEGLFAGGNEIDGLPSEIGDVSRLERLSLRRNRLTQIPNGIAGLTRLLLLWLDYNAINDLPFEIGGLYRLQELRLRQNKLAKLPSSIEQLSALRELDLSDNRLSSLPTELSNLRNLTELNLSGNALLDLPEALGNITGLEEAARYKPEWAGLLVSRNPLREPFQTLIGRGQPADTINVLAYLRGELDPASLEPPVPVEEDLVAVTTQSPAAYEFIMVPDGVDILAARPEISDIHTADDIYRDVKIKANELLTRLRQTQCPARISRSIERLLLALGDDIRELRPGVLRSHARTVEADAVAFLSEDAQRELFPEVIAFMQDLHLSLEDLQAFFPQIRKIEVEVIALGLQRADIARAREQLEQITARVVGADVTKMPAKEAIAKLDPDIAEAPDAITQAKLLADKTLVVRNFLRLAIRAVVPEVRGVAHESWREFRRGLPKGIAHGAELMGQAATVGALAWLVGTIAGPIAGLGAVIGSFGPLARKAGDIRTEVASRARKSSSAKRSKRRRKQQRDRDLAP